MSAIHGLSHKGIRVFRGEFGALEVYWIYVARSNNEGIAWPSSHGLSLDTDMSRTTVLKARRFLVERGALERVRGYIPPDWRNLPREEVGQLRKSHARREYYRITGYISDADGKRFDMLYFGGHVQSEIDESLPHGTSTAWTVNAVDSPPRGPKLSTSSQLSTNSELGTSKKKTRAKKAKTKTEPTRDPRITAVMQSPYFLAHKDKIFTAQNPTAKTIDDHEAAIEALTRAGITPEQAAAYAQKQYDERNVDYLFKWYAADALKIKAALKPAQTTRIPPLFVLGKPKDTQELERIRLEGDAS